MAQHTWSSSPWAKIKSHLSISQWLWPPGTHVGVTNGTALTFADSSVISQIVSMGLTIILFAAMKNWALILQSQFTV